MSFIRNIFPIFVALYYNVFDKGRQVESIETVPDTENDPIKQPYYITNSHTAMNENKVQELQDVVIRFSGDSGDGMQLTGTLFSDTSALLGNGISTFPDYPAEIRAPQVP